MRVRVLHSCVCTCARANFMRVLLEGLFVRRRWTLLQRHLGVRVAQVRVEIEAEDTLKRGVME